MYKNLDPNNTAYKLANSTGPRIPRPKAYQHAQAILAGHLMGNHKINSNTLKRINEKKKLLKKNEAFRQKHLKMVEAISKKKIGELSDATKKAVEKLKKNQKDIQDNLEKKTKAFTHAKQVLNQAIAGKNTKMAKAIEEYRTLIHRINTNKDIYNKKYQRVLTPSNNHLYYGRSQTANTKRDKMAKFLVKKMYFDPQKNLQEKAARYLENYKIPISPYNSTRLAQSYRVGAKGEYNTRQTGKFTLPVSIYDKNGKLKSYTALTKELMNLRHKHVNNTMNVNNAKKREKTPPNDYSNIMA